MRRASFFLTVAAGLIVSLAFTAPTQAGILQVTGVISVTGGTASDATLEFGSVVTGYTLVSETGGLSGFTLDTTLPANDLAFTFTPTSAGTFVIDLTTSSTFVSQYGLDGLAGSPTKSSLSVSWSNAVPEPTSMALLGIGMAGFLTYRRLFKRAAIA